MTNKEAILVVLKENVGGLSAVEVTKKLNQRFNETLTCTVSTISGLLKKMVDADEITRLAGMSARGGYLYLIDAKAQH